MEFLRENGRGRSEVPLIAGIIGFLATIPGIMRIDGFPAWISAIKIPETVSTDNASAFGTAINLVVALSGLYFSSKSKETPKSSGAVMIVASVLSLLMSIVTVNWFWGLAATSCFGAGGFVSLTQEKLRD